MLLPAPDTAQSIGWLALGLFGLVAGINQAMTFFARLRSEPPGEILEHENSALRERINRIEEDSIRAEACTAKHQGIEHRLSRAEKNVTEIWATFRSEDEAIRKEMARCFQDIERALGRIEGQLRTLNR